ncbi:ParB/RepB/Spo0J family partition protein [Heminiphilus faecis]|uniref:ParB/RepB/Spo0J family partition protein n=1 Tax=Heminiphilus faecis TaxID=2601703 RepID=A0ABV4CYR2_9BACT
MEATAIQTNTANVQEATISLALIQPSNYNPRKNFDEQSLTELADSISCQGILHAIGVRPITGTDRYEIVYGERRYRASLIAGKEDIKATVYTDLSDDEAEEKAIAENLHRQDITPMEEAETLKAAIDSGRYDYATLSTQIGRSETYIRTRIKLTTLIPEIARLIDTEEITVAVATEISRYGVDIQTDVYNSHLKDGVTYNDWRGMNASNVARLIEKNYTTDLSRYRFDKSACASCPFNTINLLLFCEDGCEGNCSNPSCLREKHIGYLTNKAVEMLNEHPTANFCHSEYDLNERVNALLTEMGYDIEKLSGYLTPYPCEPAVPQSDRFDTEEEYAEAVKAYEDRVEAHREKCADITAKAEAGEISLYITIGRNDVTLGYMATPAKPSENGNNPKAEIAKLEAKDKRNKEIAVERTIEDTKKKILEADITETKFSQDEDKMIYFFLLSSLRKEHYEAVGLTDRKSHSALNDSEKMTIIANLNAKTKAIIRRDFLIDNFKGAYRDNAIADLLLSFAKKHMPEELANIEAEYNEIYEKRHQRIEERKALLAKDTEPEATEPEAEPTTEEATPDTPEVAPEAENSPEEEPMPEAEPTTEEATPDTSEAETEATQYEPTEEEAEAILTEEERYCEEAVA